MRGCLGKLIVSGVACLLLFIVGGYIWTKSYLRSDEFMTLLKYGASQKLGGQVEAAETTWDGWTLKNDKIQVLAGRGFQDLELERVSVEIDPRGFVERVWKVSDVYIRECSLHLGDPLKEVEAFKPSAFPITLDWRDVGKAILPRRAEVENVTVEQCKGSFLTQGLSGHWENAEVRAERESADFLFHVPRGELTLSVLPEVNWKVEALKGRLKKDSFFINEGKLRGAEQAVFTFRGEGKYQNGGKVLQGELADLPVSAAVRADWKKRVQGLLQATFMMEAAPAGFTAQGDAWVENGVLVALPALDALAAQTGVSRFRHITLDICKGSYEVLNERLTLKDILLVSHDFLKITGEVETNGENGSGRLQLGLHTSLMEKMPKGVSKVFTVEKEAHCWTSVSLTQQDGQWKEDVSPRLMRALMRAFMSSAPESADSLIKNVKETLRNSLSGEEGADGAVNKGKALIESGVKSLFDLLGK